MNLLQVGQEILLVSFLCLLLQRLRMTDDLIDRHSKAGNELVSIHVVWIECVLIKTFADQPEQLFAARVGFCEVCGEALRQLPFRFLLHDFAVTQDVIERSPKFMPNAGEIRLGAKLRGRLSSSRGSHVSHRAAISLSRSCDCCRQTQWVTEQLFDSGTALTRNSRNSSYLSASRSLLQLPRSENQH